MTIHKTLLTTLIMLAFLLATMFTFTVDQTEYALKLRFGKVVSADYTPGLQFKLPFIDKIRYFERRIQTLDSASESFLTSEKKNVIVDSYVKWQITDVVAFYIAVAGNESRAKQRLSEIIADGLRSQFANRTIQEVVSGDRSQIMENITENAHNASKKLGISVIDVRIKRIDLPEEVSHSVYRRMEAERERVARELRSRGEAEAVRIHADADKQQTILISDAQRQAETLRGEGDALSTAIYAKAFGADPEFYSLYRSLNAYKASFNNKNDMLILEPNSEFFKYFKQMQAQ